MASKLGTLVDVLEFVENPEPRCPCVFMIDASVSMVRNGNNEFLSSLTKQMSTLKNSLQNDLLASLRVELSVVTFGDRARVVRDFTTVDKFSPPYLRIDSLSSRMDQGIRTTLNHIETRKRKYWTNGVPYFRPCVLMFTDGEPTGSSDKNLTKILELANKKNAEGEITFWMIGTPNSNPEQLRELASDGNFAVLTDSTFSQMFDRLALSLRQTVRSRTDAKVPLEPDGLNSLSE